MKTPYKEVDIVYLY